MDNGSWCRCSEITCNGFARSEHRGARPHMPVNKDAALGEFEKIAAAFPVFRLASNQTVQPTQPSGPRSDRHLEPAG
jgi:hypothetical protein